MVVRPSAGTGVLDKPGHCSLTPYNFRKYDFNSLFNGRISCKKGCPNLVKTAVPEDGRPPTFSTFFISNGNFINNCLQLYYLLYSFLPKMAIAQYANS